MGSKLKFIGHPLHQMLVVFPLVLLAGSVMCDLVHLFGESATAANVAFALIAAGLVGGVLAAPWGAIDWAVMPARTRAKSIGALHGGGNVLAMSLFLASWWLRSPQPEQPSTLAYSFSFGGAGVALLTAWLGGQLVDLLKAVAPNPSATLPPLPQDIRGAWAGASVPVRQEAPRRSGASRWQ